MVIWNDVVGGRGLPLDDMGNSGYRASPTISV